MSGINFAAFDLGAESGRAMVGTFKNDKLSLQELHRFPNKQINIDGHFHWDVPYLFNEIKTGLAKISKAGLGVLGIGIDTWGVDFGLLDAQDKLIENPFTYRDPRTNGVMEKVFQKISKRDLYERTGIQFSQINSIYQLYSMLGSNVLEKAHKLLFMPDLFNFMLTGEKFSEYTIASTSQMLNAKKRTWDMELLDILGLPKEIMATIIKPGEIIGELTYEVRQMIDMIYVDVIAVGAHDTASAVAAVPMHGDNTAYLSSGTWSLLGIESPEPLITDKSFEYSFTNEGGVNNDYRFLKNVTGLWLLQQARKQWSKQGTTYEYAELTQMAEKAEPFYAIINPDDLSFLNPPDMLKAIADFCSKTGQQIPQSPAQFTRIILESLALKYRFIVEKINEITGNQIEVLHIVGGGSLNSLLNQFTADALNIPVIAGPVEATALGNILVQLIAKGAINNLDEGRRLVKESFEQKEFMPKNKGAWDEAYAKARTLFE